MTGCSPMQSPRHRAIRKAVFPSSCRRGPSLPGFRSCQRTSSGSAKPRPVAQSRHRLRRRLRGALTDASVLAVMLLIAVLFGLGGWLVLVETTGPPATVAASSDVMGRIAEPKPGIHVPSRPQPQEQPEHRAGAPSNAASIAQALAWPAVAIIAIIALFLVARQAIAGGRNVEITWKVTEKVTGRVVITRVTNRARSSNLRVAA